jgi:hypothetical protein
MRRIESKPLVCSIVRLGKPNVKDNRQFEEICIRQTGLYFIKYMFSFIFLRKLRGLTLDLQWQVYSSMV